MSGSPPRPGFTSSSLTPSFLTVAATPRLWLLVFRALELLAQHSSPRKSSSPKPHPQSLSPPLRQVHRSLGRFFLSIPAPSIRLNPFPDPVHSAPAPSSSSQARGSTQTISSRSVAVPGVCLFPLLSPSRPSLTLSPLHLAGPNRRPCPHLPSNCWFPPPSLLLNVSRDRRVETWRARESPPRPLPAGAPGLMGYASLRRYCHLVDSLLFYSFKWHGWKLGFSLWHCLNVSVLGVHPIFLQPQSASRLSRRVPSFSRWLRGETEFPSCPLK